ncbi:VWA domain-containing protein [Frisingicoccus caecimuris]|uniref:von Willebrand factor type A domain-containing protein n=1 Tax=Frisingicoccus caecimuris TaxID=1796636 RepID=A0A4R2LC74_9FIRM|nr:vWA domain-containing protein [Frisingicoccus caecimuris]MCR1917607.1 VWA domain-containing protein [Frisingicoccus caecimuris]TCO85877.1 von Willebrand factor type A domain-containing protein [Frisingicoccus caecimuris]
MKSHKYRSDFWRIVASAALCIALLGTGIGNGSITAMAAEGEPTATKVADIDASDGYTNLMANEEYPNATTSRYAGRIWADKSVFADETIERDGKKFTNDSDFLVSASFLGSTRSVIGSEPLPVDLMVILDRSSSMANDYDANDNTTPNNRMKNAVTALNGLFQQVKEHSKDSRIALVAYSRQVVTALPLGTYTWEGDLLSTSLVEPSNDVAY